MMDLFEKSMHTLELPKVLDLLASQAVTEEGKLQLLLAQATEKDLPYILPRFEGFQVEVK